MARNGKKKKASVSAPSFPTSPPLVTIKAASLLVQTPPWNYKLTDPKGEPREGLSKFLGAELPANLESFSFGNLTDLVNVHHNVAVASLVVDKMLTDLLGVCAEKNFPHDPQLKRLIVAARLISLGVSHVTSANVLQVREHKFYHASGLGLVRTAIEMIGRGGWVALGTADEPNKVIDAHRLPRDQRLALQKTMGANKCLSTLTDRARARWAQADRPVDVYEWLCSFTHFDGGIVERLANDRGGMRQDAYAAMAYVAWFGAVMAEIVLGETGAALIPRLPPNVPWHRSP